jgi:hypothetical protein
MRLPWRHGLANEDHGEGGIACREGICGKAGSFKTRAPRSAELCRVENYAESPSGRVWLADFLFDDSA